jgi:hypothetical protein
MRHNYLRNWKISGISDRTNYDLIYLNFQVHSRNNSAVGNLARTKLFAVITVCVFQPFMIAMLPGHEQSSHSILKRDLGRNRLFEDMDAGSVLA